MLNIYKTIIMLKAIELLRPCHNFLLDRYFPHNSETGLFTTEEVLVEYKEGDEVMAPCVLPRRGGISMERQGYVTKRYTPPNVAPQFPLTVDELERKGFGESILSTKTPAQRHGAYLREDLLRGDRMIARREEWMAAQALVTNGYVLRHYADKYGEGSYEDREMRFYEGANNPSIYTLSHYWDTAEGNLFADLSAMIDILVSRGLPATDLVVAPDVVDVLLDDPRVQKYLDNRNMNMGTINPKKLPAGAVSVGKINVKGHVIEILSYGDTYADEITGTRKQFIPAGTVVLTAPAAGRTLYGAVTQFDQWDKQPRTYAGRRVPKYLVDATNDTRMLVVRSRPMPIPNYANPWVSAKVLKP